MKNEMKKLEDLCKEQGIGTEDAISLLNVIMENYDFNMFNKLLRYENVQRAVNELDHDKVVDLVEMNSASRDIYFSCDETPSFVADNDAYMGDLMLRVKEVIDEKGIIAASNSFDRFSLLCLALYRDSKYRSESDACAAAESKLARSFK